MSTEIEQAGQSITEQEVVLAEEHGSDDLLRFARDLQLAYNFSRSLVTTPFVPQQYQGNPGHAAAAIMTARGVGILDPMTALRSLDVIQGTPAFRANTLRALVQRDGHEIWVVEASSQRVVMQGRRRGDDRVQESMWDMDRARAMGLTNKDNWKKQPQAMLTARATSELARLIAADTIAGLYSVEELTDGAQPAEAAEAAPAKPAAKRTMRRKPPAPAVPAAPAPPAPSAEPEPVAPDPAPEAAADPESEAVEPVPDEPSAESTETAEAFKGDPMKPTPEEAAEWGMLPEGFGS
ncbi:MULTISPECIES: hypothetical protein [unclassified Leucobacter]|uniref:hypothetical protein n=1 Tax=unclassified Leucobacter TaxID=2621730 RepID=UPI0006228829|nr:hypothetical protein [Leucobacter sp. Ag1]KKI16399.1 hypothetical protein XM48_16555 [Leucobacter sp. Ag1]